MNLFLVDNFKVGLDLEISIEIRPRSLSGVLLSVTSAGGDYLILQMINGEVRLAITYLNFFFLRAAPGLTML